MSVWRVAHVGRGACGGQKMSNSAELEIQVVVGGLMWILGTKFRSRVRAVCALNHLTPGYLLFSHFKTFKNYVNYS